MIDESINATCERAPRERGVCPRAHTSSVPPFLASCLGLLLACSLLPGCAPYGDGAYAQKQHRREVERRTADMRLATDQVRRGDDLADDDLVQALAGRTLVQRYAGFPNGQRGEFVQYRYFAADGRLQIVDNWLEPSGSAERGDWWKVDGPRLCLLQHGYSETPSCYRMARTSAGALQWYVDDPEQPYHGLLTVVSAEFIEGPPPEVRSVLVDPTN